MSKKKRMIFHVDMDHFYTAVEEKRNLELRGRPVIVGADPMEGKGRGVVSTSNYEARKSGVKSGMPISRAWKLCPDGVYLPVNMGLYVEVSRRIMNLLRTHADKFEQWGIDEAFLDVSSRVKDYAEAETLANQIKREIFQHEELTCSVGISHSKLVAKIASDVEKPDGLKIVREDEVKGFLAPMPVRNLLGVGKKTGRKLESMGIMTIGQLSECDPVVLTEHFGVMGMALHLMANGIDESEVQERYEIKSIGRDITFQRDSDDSEFILKALYDLAEEVHADVVKQHLCFRNVTIRIRFENFETHTHGKTLPFITDQLGDLTKTARDLMRSYLTSGRKIRLVGIRVSRLVSASKQKKLV